MLPESPLVRIIVSLPIFLLGVVLHEIAHGYVAYLLGDDTAKRAGRLTLSPLAHLDPVGSLLFLFSASTGVGFGWAKPVPVMVDRLRHPRRDDMLVSLAGPGANFLQAIAWALLLRAALAWATGSLADALIRFCFLGVAVNVMLMLFNLLPIPPLDGSHVALRLLGYHDPHLTARFAPIGFLLLFLVISTRLFDLFAHHIFSPVLRLFLP